MSRDTVTSPHCPRCSRYMADVRAVFKTNLLGETLSTVYARCATHGLQELLPGHCDWCDVFFDYDSWQPSYESVKIREASKP